MNIGIPKENGTTNLERRAILLPKEVSKLVDAGHNVYFEKGLGKGIYINDDEYKAAGAELVASKRDIFDKSIVVKLKPPLPQEFKLLNNNLLFSMLHAEPKTKTFERTRVSHVFSADRVLGWSREGGSQKSLDLTLDLARVKT